MPSEKVLFVIKIPITSQIFLKRIKKIQTAIIKICPPMKKACIPWRTLSITLQVLEVESAAVNMISKDLERILPLVAMRQEERPYLNALRVARTCENRISCVIEENERLTSLWQEYRKEISRIYVQDSAPFLDCCHSFGSFQIPLFDVRYLTGDTRGPHPLKDFIKEIEYALNTPPDAACNGQIFPYQNLMEDMQLNKDGSAGMFSPKHVTLSKKSETGRVKRIAAATLSNELEYFALQQFPKIQQEV
jgi:hypothetical protein